MSRWRKARVKGEWETRKWLKKCSTHEGISFFRVSCFAFFSRSSTHQRYPRSTPNLQVMHNPSPSLRTIDTSGGPPAPQFQHINPHSTVQNSNLRAVPIVHNPSCKVKVSNLPASVDFGRISQMTTACGGVKTIQVRKINSSLRYRT